MDDTKYIELTKEQAHEDFKRRFGIIDDNVELRDKFAMAALTGMCASNTQWKHAQEVSILAYKTADAMLEARSK